MPLLHMTPSLGIEPGSHWWEAKALTTAPSLHPLIKHNLYLIECYQLSLIFFFVFFFNYLITYFYILIVYSFSTLLSSFLCSFASAFFLSLFLSLFLSFSLSLFFKFFLPSFLIQCLILYGFHSLAGRMCFPCQSSC